MVVFAKTFTITPASKNISGTIIILARQLRSDILDLGGFMTEAHKKIIEEELREAETRCWELSEQIEQLTEQRQAALIRMSKLEIELNRHKP